MCTFESVSTIITQRAFNARERLEVVLTAVASDGAVGLVLSAGAVGGSVTQLVEGDAHP